MISQRTINARAIFEQNTCAGQMSSVQTSRQPKILQEFEENQARLESQPNKSPVYTSPVTEQPPEQLQEVPKIIETASPPEEFNYTRNLLKEPPRQDSEMEPNAEEEQNWDGKR